MKIFRAVIIIMAIQLHAWAQPPQQQNLKPAKQYEIITQATKYTHRIATTIGYAYHSEDLYAMPTRSINKIASLTMGVNYNGSGTPIIKGVKEGVAYFVDGVRIRSGALGIAGYPW